MKKFISLSVIQAGVRNLAAQLDLHISLLPSSVLKILNSRIKYTYSHLPALKQVQIERPSYAKGHEAWWGEVIRRTAVGAGASSEGQCAL